MLALPYLIVTRRQKDLNLRETQCSTILAVSRNRPDYAMSPCYLIVIIVQSAAANTSVIHQSTSTAAACFRTHVVAIAFTFIGFHLVISSCKSARPDLNRQTSNLAS